MKNTIKNLFCVLIFTTPLFFNFLPRDPFEINKFTIVSIVTTIIFTIWLVEMIKNKNFKIPRSGIILFAFIYLLFNILSLIFSIHPYTSLFGNYWRMSDGTLSLINYFVLFFIVSITTTSSEKKEQKSFIDAILFSIIVASAIVSIMGILQYFNINLWGLALDASRIISTIGQPNFLGAFLLFSIPITFLFLINSKRILSLILFSTFILIDTIALVLTFSRSAWLGLVVLVILFCIYFVKKIRKNKKILLLFPLIILVSFFIFYKPVMSRLNFLNKELFAQNTFNANNILSRILASRYYAWEGAIGIVKDNLILGTGPETFLFSFPKYRDPRLDQTEIVWGIKYDKAHNDLLNIATNTGIFSLVAYLLMIVFMFIAVRKMKLDDWHKQCAIVLSVAILVFLVSNLFGFPSVSTNLYFWITLGIIAGLSSRGMTINFIFEIRRKFIFTIFLFIFLFLFLVYSSTLSVKNYLADVYFNKGFYEVATKLNPSLDFYHGNLALNYLAQGEKEKAIFETKRAINSNINNTDNILVLIMVYKALGEEYRQDIIDLYNEALKLEPNNPKIYFEKAEYLVSINNKEDAIIALSRALEIKTNYNEAKDFLENLR